MVDEFEIDENLENINSYNEFLSRFVTHDDLVYLEDEALARDVVELYENNKGDIRCKEDFERKKREYELRGQEDKNDEKPLYSQGKDFPKGSFLDELKKREPEVRNGRKSTIIFIRYKDLNGKETSAYIDYRERLKNDNFEDIFNEKKDLIPKSTDLSFYSWNVQKVSHNDSTFFRVDAGPKERLSFRNNSERKSINVDLEYLEKNRNLDVDRIPITIKISEDEADKFVELKNKETIIKRKMTVELRKKIIKNNPKDNKEIGYQQIVIFDYQTRNK